MVGHIFLEPVWFKHSALSILIKAKIFIVHAVFNTSFKDGLSCGVYVNLSGDLFVGWLSRYHLTHSGSESVCVCVSVWVMKGENKREAIQCNHTWPASTHAVMGKAACKHNSPEKTRKDEKISGSSKRREGQDWQRGPHWNQCRSQGLLWWDIEQQKSVLWC